MTRRVDTLKKAYIENREALKEVPSNPKEDTEGKKYLYKKGVVVDAAVKYGVNKDGDLTAVINATKSRTAALDKGEAYGGYNFDRRGLKGPGIADILGSIKGEDTNEKTRDERVASLKDAVEKNGGPITDRVAFETTTFKNKAGKATISLKADDIKPTTIDFKEEDKLRDIAKSVRESEAEAAKAEATPAPEADQEEIDL